MVTWWMITLLPKRAITSFVGFLARRRISRLGIRWFARHYDIDRAILDRPLQEALEDFARVRRRTVDLLHGWGKPEWDRTISDPRGADLTLLEVCQLVARHEMAHIAQIRNLSALLPETQDLGPARPSANGN